MNPAAEVGRLARAADVLYLLDATQTVGQLPIDVSAIGCDMLTGTGRKFLRGPRGTGFLYAGERAIDRLEPFVAEIHSATWDGARSFTWVDGAQRFETWENSYVNVLGLGAAVRQALDLGVDWIGARSAALGARLRDGLAQIDGVTVHDLGREQCAIVTARVAGVDTAAAAAELSRQGINVSTTVAEHNQLDTEVRDVHPMLRLSPHYFNTEAEIDRAVEAIAGLATIFRVIRDGHQARQKPEDTAERRITWWQRALRWVAWLTFLGLAIWNSGSVYFSPMEWLALIAAIGISIWCMAKPLGGTEVRTEGADPPAWRVRVPNQLGVGAIRGDPDRRWGSRGRCGDLRRRHRARHRRRGLHRHRGLHRGLDRRADLPLLRRRTRKHPCVRAVHLAAARAASAVVQPRPTVQPRQRISSPP